MEIMNFKIDFMVTIITKENINPKQIKEALKIFFKGNNINYEKIKIIEPINV